MNRPVRIGLIILGILLVLILVIAVSGNYAAKRPFPNTNDTLALKGLQDEVTVCGDSYGVPHIYASNQNDLFFAQGYTTARERFWQMEFSRHIGMGRISEIAGEATVKVTSLSAPWARIVWPKIILIITSKKRQNS